MTKRVIVAHGWDGHPQEGWFPWLKDQLEEKGFEVIIPQLPDPESPRIYNWVPALAEAVGVADADTYFVGHSMGCQAIARYLEKLPEDLQVGGAVFVAGFFKRLSGLEDDEEVQETDRHWLTTPVDLEKVKKHCKKSIALFSDDDPYVPLDNKDDFKDKLGSEIVVMSGMGHFSGGQNGVTRLPILLDLLKKLFTD